MIANNGVQTGAADMVAARMGEVSAPLGVRLLFQVYLQIAAILGALGLISYLQNFTHIDWHAAFHGLFSLWDATIRPAVKSLTDAICDFLQWAFGLSIEVPQQVRDYLAAGGILALSMFRAIDQKSVFRGFLKLDALALLAVIPFLLVSALAWPLMAALLFAGLWRDDARMARAIATLEQEPGAPYDEAHWLPIAKIRKRDGFLALAPLAYAVAILLANRVLQS